jgi:hypothetical protein
MLDEARFWQIIDSSREQARQKKLAKGQDFIDVHEQTLAESLRTLPPDQIAAFNDRFWEVHQRAYRWDLWGAAYWLHGGCSDDGFIDYRACLISLGKDLFQRVLNDPDTIADLVDRPDVPYMQAEGFQYIAGRVYEEKTGKSMPLGESSGIDEPEGEKFDFDDEEVMSERFPKLLAKFPEMGD